MVMDREKALKTAILVLAAVLVIAGVWSLKVKRDRATEAYRELSEAEMSDLGNETAEAANKVLCIDICGAVANEGYYELPPGSRVVDAVAMAGGLLETADTRRINLAQKIFDQQKIIIPVTGEFENGEVSGNGLVNINTAGKAVLESLPGIGPVYAERIISYREKSGGFQNKEDIKKIKGIGEKTYEDIEECICVY